MLLDRKQKGIHPTGVKQNPDYDDVSPMYAQKYLSYIPTLGGIFISDTYLVMMGEVEAVFGCVLA